MLPVENVLSRSVRRVKGANSRGEKEATSSTETERRCRLAARTRTSSDIVAVMVVVEVKYRTITRSAAQSSKAGLRGRISSSVLYT